MKKLSNNFNILIILPHSIGGRIIISQFISGLKANNLNFSVFDEIYDENFLKKFQKEPFNLMIGYDFSALKLKVDNNLNIKCLNYFADVIQDNHSGIYWIDYFKHLNNSQNNNFYWDKALCDKEIEIKNLYYQPLFVNIDEYKNLNLKKHVDILFAGRLDSDLRLDLFTNLMKTYKNLNFHWYAIEKHFEDAYNRTDDKKLLKKVYKGFLNTPEKLVHAINHAKIVINENSQGISSINFRTIESMACETIVLSDYREEINCFKGDLPFYTDFEDLKLKINYYLENKQAYESTVKNCRKWIEKNHNAKIEILKMLEQIK